jgi:hypothetical protein
MASDATAAETAVGGRGGDPIVASDVRAGDVLRLRTGEVRVDKAYRSHGGAEIVVRPVGGSTPRALWFWPSDVILVVARSSSTGAPGAAIAGRPARGAAGRSRKAGAGGAS